MSKIAFFITPLGKEGSQVRDRADWVTTVVLKPELASMGYEIRRAGLSPFTDPITDEIARYLYRAELVIADVTEGNPNVMYELGRRHAWGEPCLLVAERKFDPRELPFDISSYPVAVRYEKTTNTDKIEKYRAQLGAHVAELQSQSPRIRLPGGENERRRIASRLGRSSGLSFLISRFDGRQDHYRMAQRIIDRPIDNLFLMQRSSTLVLGPEQGWRWEKRFYELILQELENGSNLYHLVSLEGIKRHLERNTSHFPEVETVADRLQHLGDEGGGIVAIPGRDGPIRFKKLPPESEEGLKPDRQARTLIVEFGDGDVEGLIVADLGEAQSAFLLSGPEMKSWLEDCINYFHRCEYLFWEELEDAVTG